MKKFKPYLFLEKKGNDYELNFVISCNADQTIESISQFATNPAITEGPIYWNVEVVLSTITQLANGPISPIYSSKVQIEAAKVTGIKTIICTVIQKTNDNLVGPTEPDTSSIDFTDI